MPRYESIEDLPDTMRDILPESAQQTYLEVYTEAWDTHAAEEEAGEEGRHAVAHRKGWTAVEAKYVKDEKTGRWYPRGEEPEGAADGGILDKLADLV